MEERKTLDSIIHRLKEIQINSEDAVSWAEVMSWADVTSWIVEEIERNSDLINDLEDIIRELEEENWKNIKKNTQ